MIFESAIWAVTLAVLGIINLKIVAEELVTSKKNGTGIRYPGVVIVNVIGFACAISAVIMSLADIKTEEKELRETIIMMTPADSTSRQLPPATYEITHQ